MFNGEGDFFEMHQNVFGKGLKGMDARKFLPHLFGVVEVLKGNGELYDATGNLIKEDRLKDYAMKLSHNCNVYLNGHLRLSEERREGQGFVDGGLLPMEVIAQPEGFRKLDLARITSYRNGKSVSSREPLLPCLERDCWADITLESLNAQGLPTKKSPIGERYEPGRTAYFMSPKEAGDVIGFSADKKQAIFSCFRNGRDSYSDLGTFTSPVIQTNQVPGTIEITAAIFEGGRLVREVPVEKKYRNCKNLYT
jgi:hypothetical protein